jgi:hypothetical protein
MNTRVVSKLLKHYRVKSVGIIGLLIAGVVGFITQLDDEPVEDGRTLSEWIRFGQDNHYRRDNTDVTNAIRRIGETAIPVLVAKLRAKTPPWKEKLHRALDGRFLPSGWFYSPFQQHGDANYGFSILGAQAAPTIPELSRMLFDTNTHGVSASALGYVGAEARPILLSALTNANPSIRIAAVVGLTVSTEMARASATNVLPLVHDPDMSVALTAGSRSMSWLPPPQGLDVAFEALRDSRPFVQEYALRCLQVHVKTNRTSLLSSIIPLLQSPDPRLRETATNMFREISSPQEIQRGR